MKHFIFDMAYALVYVPAITAIVWAPIAFAYFVR